MNERKKYKRSHLRDLPESVFTDLSLSVSPSLQSGSNPPFLPRNRSLFLTRNSGPSMAQKIRTFQAPILEWETSLRHGERSFTAAYPRRPLSCLQVRCGKDSLCCCIAKTICCTSLQHSLLWSFLLLLASFFISISPCSMKHYSIGIGAISMNMNVNRVS